MESPKNPERVQQIMTNESFQKFVGRIVQQVNVVHKVRMYLLVLRLRRGEGQGIRKSEATKN